MNNVIEILEKKLYDMVLFTSDPLEQELNFGFKHGLKNCIEELKNNKTLKYFESELEANAPYDIHEYQFGYNSAIRFTIKTIKGDK